MGVTVLDSVDDLDEDLAGLDLVEFAHLLDVLHELTAAGQLHNHYQLLSLNEGVVQLHNVLVSQLLDAIRLLVNRVNFISAVQDLSHVHVFDGVLFFGFFVCGQMNGTKATFANFLVHCVVIENSAVIEVLPVESDIENIAGLDEVDVVAEDLDALLIVKHRLGGFLFATKALARLFQDILQRRSVLLAKFNMALHLRLVYASVHTDGYLTTTVFKKFDHLISCVKIKLPF